MSPITDSFSAMWTLCDLRISDGNETLAELFINLGDLFGLDASYSICEKNCDIEIHELDDIITVSDLEQVFKCRGFFRTGYTWTF